MRSLTVFLFAAMSAPMVPVLAESTVRGAAPVKVLLIGDSLSVSGFGKVMQDSLVSQYGDKEVAVFASCGSSPEDWTKGGFVTTCGFRQKTPGSTLIMRDRERVKTPRLRTILGYYRPEFVMVQLGTNWMDALRDSGHSDGARYRGIIRDFVRELRRGNPAVAVVWVMPPASSAYPLSVHAQVEEWINDESRKLGFYTVNSRSLTGPYRLGVTGGDGVHYTEAAGGRWARGVFQKFLAVVKSSTLAPRSPAR